MMSLAKKDPTKEEYRKGGCVRLFVPDVHASYSGKIYFILGPGLGDTVNSFRILHEVLRLYPNARSIAYTDPRWQFLYDLIPEFSRCEVRSYRPAPSAQTPHDGLEKPYHKIFDDLMREINMESLCEKAYLALGAFKQPDQLARKENLITTSARAIGLQLDQERCRPYLPVSAIWKKKCQSFLKEKDLSPRNYVVVAPYTWPDKMWKGESWEQLITEIYDRIGLRILIIGATGCPSLRALGLSELIGRPLPLVAAVIKQARCFVGLDSGPTHIAAAFDIPIVTLNPQGKFPPFLIEAHSPFRWTLLTPRIYGQEAISVEAACEVVVRALSNRVPQNCPLCGRQPFILGAKREQILYLCRCGLIFRQRDRKTWGNQSGQKWGVSFTLPSTVLALESLRDWLQGLGENGCTERPAWLQVEFDGYDPTQLHPEAIWEAQDPGDLWWTWDAAYYFITACG